MTSLLQQYKVYAADHGTHTEEGDSDATNASYYLLQKTFLELIKVGKGRELVALYDDPNPWVQSWAASHSLEIDEASALRKLAEIEAADIPLVSTSAKYTIRGWKAGQLRFVK